MTCHRYLPLGLAVLLSSLPLPLQASGIPETVEWEFVEMSHDLAERLVELRTDGTPLSHANTRIRGQTTWQLTWDYRARDEIMRCSVDKVLLTLTIRHRLPVLPKEDLPDNAREVFGPVYKVLHAHEQQHAAHAREAAREVDRVMRMLPAQESCEILEKRLRVLVGGVLDDYRTRDETLDAVTDFGWKLIPR
jgi:predicted secreted Zn-dependent protease